MFYATTFYFSNPNFQMHYTLAFMSLLYISYIDTNIDKIYV